MMSIPALESLPLIQTKLHRPLVPVDLVSRSQLIDWLDERRHRPLTLVSAPAGYGKSTLISSWLDTCKYPNTWLSLDEGDNDLAVFLSYFLEAICIIFPEAAKNSQALLTAHTQPPIKELVINLSNEINQLDQFFVLVLDDFEVIQENLVHDFLNEFLLHPPQDFHLVLCSRIDPPLSIQKLRAQGQLTEIRAQDLRFSVEESYTFLQNMLGTTVDIATARYMDEQSEGWVTGLRLAALALRHRVGSQDTEEKPTANNRYVWDYLMSEILDSQKTGFSEWLIKTSILARFNAGLCEAVCIGKSELDGDSFLEWLVAANLFAIPLDDHNQWVRYHHLFREFLEGELARRYDSAEVAALHARASDWFAQNGLIEEALRHALAAGDVMGAAQLVEQNRNKILRTGLWHILGKWLDQLPDEIVEQRQALLMARAWVSSFQGVFEKIPLILETIDGLLETQTIEKDLEGDLDYFNGVLLFWEGQIETSLDLFQRAVERIPSANLGGRNEAEIYFATASHMAGQGEMVAQTYQQMLLNETSDSPRKGYLLASLAFIHLFTGKLTMVYEVAKQMEAFGTRNKNDIVGGWGSYLMGYVHFEWNNFETASHHFSQAVKKRYFLDVNTPIDSYAGLIFSYQLMGQSDKANQTVKQMLEFAQQSNNPSHIILARSVQARLSLLQGDLWSAVLWLETADISSDAGTMFFFIDLPRITQCRVLVAQGTEDSWQKANEKLQEYWQMCHATHNTPKMIELLLLQVQVHYKQAQTDEALAALERAITLAEPGGWIRPFVEAGSELIRPLTQLAGREGVSNCLGKILAAFETEGDADEGISVPPLSQLFEPLTNREFEILELLGKRLTNKEIAAELYISVGTVQQHLNHIYNKLDVKGRRQAVVKAKKLNLLAIS
jgi:LuxR family maltose regulon positive regulatory protein